MGLSLRRWVTINYIIHAEVVVRQVCAKEQRLPLCTKEKKVRWANEGCYRMNSKEKQMVALTIYIWTIYKWNTTVPCTELPSWTTCIMIPPVASATTGIQNMDTKQTYLRSARLRSSSSGCPGWCQGSLFDPWSLWPWDKGTDRGMGEAPHMHSMTIFDWKSCIPTNDANGTSNSVTIGWKNTWEVWKIALY